MKPRRRQILAFLFIVLILGSSWAVLTPSVALASCCQVTFTQAPHSGQVVTGQVTLSVQVTSGSPLSGFVLGIVPTDPDIARLQPGGEIRDGPWTAQNPITSDVIAATWTTNGSPPTANGTYKFLATATALDGTSLPISIPDIKVNNPSPKPAPPVVNINKDYSIHIGLPDEDKPPDLQDYVFLRSVTDTAFAKVDLDCSGNDISAPTGVGLRYEVSVIRRSPIDPHGLSSSASDPSQAITGTVTSSGTSTTGSNVGLIRYPIGTCPNLLQPIPSPRLVVSTTPTGPGNVGTRSVDPRVGPGQSSNPPPGTGPGQPGTPSQPAFPAPSTQPGISSSPAYAGTTASQGPGSTPSPSARSSDSDIPPTSGASLASGPRNPSPRTLQTGSSAISFWLPLLAVVVGGAGALVWLLRSMRSP